MRSRCAFYSATGLTSDPLTCVRAKADLKADTPPGGATPTATPQSTLSHTAFEDKSPAPPAEVHPAPGAAPAAPEAQIGSDGVPSLPSKGQSTTSASFTPATSPPPTPTAIPAGQLSPAERKAAAEKKAAERAAEREKMEVYERERAEEKRERVRTLVQKLLDRIRPFVEASNPGDANDPETKKYADRIREEAHDLAMESFGVGERSCLFCLSVAGVDGRTDGPLMFVRSQRSAGSSARCT